MSKKRLAAYLALFTASLIWGLAPPIIKYTLRFVSPLEFLFYRLLFASILIALPLFLTVKKIRPSLNDLLLYLFLGFLCTPLNLLLLFWGIDKTTAIDASLISIVSPVLVILGGAFFLKENVTKIEKAGISFTVLGAILTVAQPFGETGLSATRNFSGNLLVLAGTLVWVVFTLLVKKHRQKKLDPFLLAGLSFLIGLIVLLPMYLYEKWLLIDYLKSVSQPISSTLSLDPKALPGLLYLAALSSVVAYFAYLFGLSKIEASEATVFTYLQPLFAVPTAVLFLGEKLTLPFCAGAILIVSGIFICETRPRLTSFFPKIVHQTPNFKKSRNSQQALQFLIGGKKSKSQKNRADTKVRILS